MWTYLRTLIQTLAGVILITSPISALEPEFQVQSENNATDMLETPDTPPPRTNRIQQNRQHRTQTLSGKHTTSFLLKETPLLFRITGVRSGWKNTASPQETVTFSYKVSPVQDSGINSSKTIDLFNAFSSPEKADEIQRKLNAQITNGWPLSNAETAVENMESFADAVKKHNAQDAYLELTVRFMNNGQKDCELKDLAIPFHSGATGTQPVARPSDGKALTIAAKGSIDVRFRASLTDAQGMEIYPQLLHKISTIADPQNITGLLSIKGENNSIRQIADLSHTSENEVIVSIETAERLRIDWIFERSGKDGLTSIGDIISTLNTLSEKEGFGKLFSLNGNEIDSVAGYDNIPKFNLWWWWIIADGETINDTDYLAAPTEAANIVFARIPALPHLNLKEFQKLASESHDDWAINTLGAYFLTGNGISSDPEKAMPYFNMSAENRSAKGLFWKGYCFYSGNGVAKDYQEGLKFFRLAAEAGHPEAFGFIGDAYRRGNGVEQDFTAAAQWYRAAAEHGILPALLTAAFCDSRGGPEKQQEAFAVYAQEAKAGTARAQTALAHAYMKGQGTEQDHEKAIKWYKIAAYQGYAEAQMSLADCYYNGKGVTKNPDEAMKWYRQAADSGISRALVVMANCYMRDNSGIEKNPEEGIKLLQEAITKGNTRAMYNLANCYIRGNGVDKDPRMAVSLFKMASDKGNTTAMTSLANCYLRGLGAEKNQAEAFSLFQKAAEQGNVAAIVCLGDCYMNGNGVAKNQTEAIKLWEKAAEQGNKTARERLNKAGR